VDKEFFDGAYAIDEKGASVRALLNRRSTLGEYSHDDLMLQAAANGNWKPLQMAVIVPVYCEDEPIGTLNVYHPDASAFSEYDKQLLELIAERASHAIKYGAMFDRARGDSVTDPLTGAFNLRFLTEYVESLSQVAENGHQMRHAVLCLDLDSFKSINDNFGHLKGDSVLKSIANLLRDYVGENGIVARYGGDEFVVVLTDSGKCQAAKSALAVSDLIASYDPDLHHLTLGKLKVSASIGFACYPEDGRDGASLIAAADQRMYASKTEHRLRMLARDQAA
jgi:diguanylate cyclase (GGDEF)-like protein